VDARQRESTSSSGNRWPRRFAVASSKEEDGSLFPPLAPIGRDFEKQTQRIVDAREKASGASAADKRAPPTKDRQDDSEAPDLITTARRLAQLRQETATFAAQKRYVEIDQSLSSLKLLMARSAYMILLSSWFMSLFVLADHRAFSTPVVLSASSTLLIQSTGLMVWIWKMVIARPTPRLKPVTRADPPASSQGDATVPSSQQD
jgi:hypothetical protein